MDRNIKLMALFNFLIDFAFYTPVAIIYFSHVSGSYALGMSIFSITMFSSALFEIPTGIFSDYIGRKNTIVCGAISGLFAVIFYAIGGVYMFLAIGAIFEGLGRAFFSGNDDAFLHDILSESKQSHKFHEFLGKLSSYNQFGLAAVAILGGFLASKSLFLVMWLSVIPKMLNIIVAIMLKEPKVHSPQSGNIYYHLKEALRQFRTNHKLRLLTYKTMIGYALGEASYLFRGTFISSLWPIWALGITNMFSNLGAAASFYFSGKIIDKIGFKKSLYLDTIYCRIANLIALVFPGIYSPALMSTTSITYGFSSVSESTLLQNEFTSGQRATLGSLNSFFGSILFGIIAILLGLLADKTNPRIALICINILQFVPLWFIYRFFKK